MISTLLISMHPNQQRKFGGRHNRLMARADRTAAENILPEPILADRDAKRRRHLILPIPTLKGQLSAVLRDQLLNPNSTRLTRLRSAAMWAHRILPC